MCSEIFLIQMIYLKNHPKLFKDVPVDVIYNSKTHVTKIPENVDVNLTGPQSKLIKIENPEDLKVVVDLSGKKGKYQKISS